MNFSEHWKSIWAISSVFDPPLLISKPSSNSLGPLLFFPCPQTLNLLLTSPRLSSPFSLPPFSCFDKKPKPSSPSQSIEQIPTPSNNLQILQYSKNEYLLFFPFGDGLDRVGFVKIGVKGLKVEILDDEDEVFETEHVFESKIERILVSSVLDGECGDKICSPKLGKSVIIGFLFACTLDSVHWYRVEIGKKRSVFGNPVLGYLGSRKFSSLIMHACWSPHLPEESLFLLGNGDLFLFDVEFCSISKKVPVKMDGKRIRVPWKCFDLDMDDDSMGKKNRWLSCGFSWHPQIYVVACSLAIFLVDCRLEETDVSILAQVEMVRLNRSVGSSQFIAFCMVGSDGFYYTVATEEHIFLMDVRKPMMTVLQWVHGLDNPHSISVFRLSDLWSKVDDEFKWAYDSGFAILLGSFLSSKFSLFCYGPPLPTPDESVASRVSNFSDTLYAWELPTDFSMLNRLCNCGNCLLAHEFSNQALPKWKKERILGYCIIGGAVSDPLQERDRLSNGFTLIRLLSSGKLESQEYYASKDFTEWKFEESIKSSLHLEDSFLYLFIDQEYKFLRNFKFFHLDSLVGYMNDDLPKVLMSKMMKTFGVCNTRLPYTQDSYQRLTDILRAAGVGSFGVCPSIKNILNNITYPMNTFEIASNRMWGGLKVDILQLAFTVPSELRDVLVQLQDYRIAVEALEISSLPQLPPFFSKEPTLRSSNWSYQSDDVLVGPVLPLPFLTFLQKLKKDNKCLMLENEDTEDAEVTRQCDEVMRVASEMALSESHPEPNSSPVVSLGNDKEDNWVPSQEPKLLFFVKPSALSKENKSSMDTAQRKLSYENDWFGTFISKTRDKENTANTMKEPVTSDFFDDVCSVELNFDLPEVNFGTKERQGYKLLKRQFSKWENDYRPYRDFCNSLKIHKRV